MGSCNVRFRWVRRQGNLLDIDDIVATVGIAVLEGVLAGNIERIPENSAAFVGAVDSEGAGARSRSKSDNGRREPHVFGFGDGFGDGGDSWDAGGLRSHNKHSGVCFLQLQPRGLMLNPGMDEIEVQLSRNTDVDV